MKCFICTFNLNGQKMETHDLKKMENSVEYAGTYSLKVDSFMDENGGMVVSSPSHFNETTKIYKINSLCIVGDIRIDNRYDVVEVFKLTEYWKVKSDEMIFLHLYDLYGKTFLSKIVGEYSFVIWDSNQQHIFAARDQMGIKTLYWIKNNDEVCIASDIALLKDKFSPYNINKEYFYEYYLCNGSIDSFITPFKQVNRLPSANWMTVKNGELKVEQYWDITENNSEISYPTERQYEEQFLQLLEKSVECRLDKSSENAVLMSGGLDSTSVYAIANSLLKKNYSKATVYPVCGIFDKYLECDEREYITPILKMHNQEAVYHICDENISFRDFPDDSPWSYEPFVNSATFAFTNSLIHRAKISGATNILTGYGGDHVLGGTELVIADLVGKYSIVEALRHSADFAKKCRFSALHIFWNRGLAPHFKRGFYKEIIQNRNQEFIHKLDQVESFNQKEFIRQIIGTRARLYTERVIAPIDGVNIQNPFLDRRLVEYLFRIPGWTRWVGGRTKYILRKAMVDYLPPEVLWRVNKTRHVPLTYKGIQDGWANLYSVLKKGRVTEFGWINKDDWLDLLHRWRQGQEIRDDTYLLAAIEIWLYRLENHLNK
ncbi:asparagine synthetase B family protein [Paenibacillus sp. MBLB4367]|uniref:asparagine synthetase B family protein n=1 Tax=Paenibacillus sp. MBLB4367 TaxID=3384767 RepID=UPI003907FEB1